MNRVAAARSPWTESPPGLRGWLSGAQFGALMFLSVFPTIILLVPADLVRAGGRYGWWTPIAAAPPAMILGWATGRLAGGRGDTVRAAMRSLGPVAGRGVLALEWAGLAAYVVVIARELSETALATIVSGALPLGVMTALCVTASLVLAWWGPVVMGRTAVLLAPVLVAVFAVVAAAILPSSHVMWALPLWPDNTRFVRWLPLSLIWVWTAEPAFLAAVLMGHADAATRKTAGRSLALVVLGVTVLTALLTWITVAKLGPQGATILTLPLSGMVDNLGFGPSVLNLETAIFPIVAMGSVLKLALFLWVWARLGSGLTGIGLKTALVVQGVAAGCVGLVVFQNVAILNRTLPLLGDTALPALVATTLLVYVRSRPHHGSPRA